MQSEATSWVEVLEREPVLSTTVPSNTLKEAAEVLRAAAAEKKISKRIRDLLMDMADRLESF